MEQVPPSGWRPVQVPMVIPMGILQYAVEEHCPSFAQEVGQASGDWLICPLHAWFGYGVQLMPYCEVHALSSVTTSERQMESGPHTASMRAPWQAVCGEAQLAGDG
jgi:hypothetical protein